MPYLLDTNAISDVVRGVPQVKARFRFADPSWLYVSTVTLKEIAYGRCRHPEQAKRRSKQIDTLLSELTTIPFDAEDAEATGWLRAVLARRGTPIGPYDVMIAGTALARDLVLVTANTREFERVPGIQLEDWRSASFGGQESRATYRISRSGSESSWLAA